MILRRLFRAALCAALLAVAPIAHALRLMPTDVTCPIDGKPFQYSRAISGTSFGQHLDLKPFGAIAAPVPLAKCPGNGFVMYKQSFSADEIARIKPFVESAEYQTLQQTHRSYYLAALLQRRLDEAPRIIAGTLLQATWEAFGEQYTLYASEALTAYHTLIAASTANDEQWLTDQLIAGELERRLGRFDDALARFTALHGHERAQTGVYRAIVELQLRLVAAKDRTSHQTPAR